MIFYYIKRDFNLKMIFMIQILLIFTLFFMNFVFRDYEQDYKKANKIKIGVVNMDSSDNKSVLLIENFKSNEQFSSLFEILLVDKKDALEKFKKGEIDSYVEIPQGFSDGLMHYENQNLNVFVDVKNPTKNMILSHVFKAYSNFIKGSNLATYSLYNVMEEAGFSDSKLRTINNSFSVEMVGTALNRTGFFEVKKHTSLPIVDALRYFLYALPLAFVSFLSIDHGINYLRARKSFVLKRESLIINSKVKLIVFDIFSKTISTFSIFIPISALQFAFYGWAVFLQSAFILFFSILSLVMFWRILSFVITSEFGISVFGSFIAFGMSLISGCIVPFIFLPQGLKSVAEFLPHFWFLKLSMPIKYIGWNSFIIGIFILICVILLEFLLEYRMLKRELM